jgi:hypothetical protein
LEDGDRLTVVEDRAEDGRSKPNLLDLPEA